MVIVDISGAMAGLQSAICNVPMDEFRIFYFRDWVCLNASMLDMLERIRDNV